MNPLVLEWGKFARSSVTAMSCYSRVIKGRRYWYSSRKENGEVITEYLGPDGSLPVKRKVEALHLDQSQKNLEKVLCQEKVKKIEEQGKFYDEIFNTVKKIVQDSLTKAGYYRHNRGEWRKRRK
jgi:hypothetical protein